MRRMSQKTPRTIVETLGDLRDHGMGLYANCTALNAGHGALLDLDALIARYGEDFVHVGSDVIASACVCRKCGHRGATLTVMANTKIGGFD